jgi:hypothetical protein
MGTLSWLDKDEWLQYKDVTVESRMNKVEKSLKNMQGSTL